MPKFIYKPTYLNAIVYCTGLEGRKRQNFLKFHSIKDAARQKGKFLDFIKKNFTTAQHVNFYDKETKAFVERIYLE